MMLQIERFMASAMSLVRIAPEAPTRAPAMISTGLPMTKPAIAAAVPVNEFSSEMTTGMSAPPMGSTSVMPKHQRGDARPAGAQRRRRVVSVIAPAAPSTQDDEPDDRDDGQGAGRPGVRRGTMIGCPG